MNINNAHRVARPVAPTSVASTPADIQAVAAWTFTASPSKIKSIEAFVQNIGRRHGLEITMKTDIVSTGGWFDMGAKLSLTVKAEGSEWKLETIGKVLEETFE
jgi:hypothetical protein